MNSKLFQHLFDRKSQESSSRTRRLALESLENREMLNVDWSGFGPEKTTTYVSPEASSCSVDLPSNVDSVSLVNLEGDAKSELVSIYGKGKTVSVYKASSDGKYTLKTEQTFEELGNWGMYSYATFADFNNDGFEDMLLLTSSGADIKASVYSWNSASSKFVQSGSSYQLDTTPFVGSSSTYVFTEISGAILSNASGGYDLALQVGTLGLGSAGMTTTTAIYAGVGSASFGTNPVSKSAITGTLLGSTKINGESYLLLKDASASTNTLVLSKIGSTTVTKTYYDFSSYGSKFVFNSVAETDGFVVVGSILGGSMKSGLVTLNLTAAPPDNTTVDATTLGQWIDCNSISLGPATVMSIGDVVGDADPELLIANDEEHASVFFLGDASTSYGYTFTESTLVVSSPEYNSVYVGDYDNDNKKEAVLVGNNYIYVGDVDSTGALTNLTEMCKFSQPVEKAVFGYFDDDLLLDVAVQFKANVGSSLQVYRQVYNGSFVPFTTTAISGSFVDLTVGKFTQTQRDEIAVLSASYKSSSTWSSVNVYKLDATKSSLVSVLSSSYEGAGTSIASGELYGSGRSDLVVTNTSADTITVFRNGGASLVVAGVTTRFDGTNACYPTSSAIGDFNGDGLADLAVMNSSSGSNAAEVVYYLRTSSGLGSKPTGRVAINNTITTVDNTAIVGKLLACDLNGDGFSDLTFVRKATNQTTYVSTLMGNGASSVFDSLVNQTASCDPSSPYGVALMSVDSANSSKDFIWAQGKNFAVLLNGAEGVPNAYVKYVLQNASANAGDSLEAAISTQPTWLDEWSTFYVDVWANPGSGSVASVSGSFGFDSSIFTFSEAVAATGYAVSASADSGVVSFAANGSATADAQGWTVVARLKFSPVENGGIDLRDTGEIFFVNPGFSAGASAQKINGSAVVSAEIPTGVEVYPFIYDLNDNGEVDLNDFAQFIGNYPAKPTSNISVARYRVLDVNGNDEYDLNDYAYALASYPLKCSTLDGDYAYQVKPVISAASSALLEMAILDEDEVDFFADDLDLEAIAENIVADDSRGVEQRVASTDQAAERPVFCGPLTKADAFKFDLGLELETEF